LRRKRCSIAGIGPVVFRLVLDWRRAIKRLAKNTPLPESDHAPEASQDYPGWNLEGDIIFELRPFVFRFKASPTGTVQRGRQCKVRGCLASRFRRHFKKCNKSVTKGQSSLIFPWEVPETTSFDRHPRDRLAEWPEKFFICIITISGKGDCHESALAA
jgi:hypothetical protein